MTDKPIINCKRYEPKLWDPNGRAIHVKDMEDGHLNNSLALVERTELFPNRREWIGTLKKEIIRRKRKQSFIDYLNSKKSIEPAVSEMLETDHASAKDQWEAMYFNKPNLKPWVSSSVDLTKTGLGVKEVWIELCIKHNNHLLDAMTGVAEQSLGIPPAKNNYNNQEDNNMGKITGGPLRGLKVGDTAYTILSGAVTIISLDSNKFSGRPIRVQAKLSDVYASFREDGVKRLNQSHQQLFKTEAAMLVARAESGMSNTINPINTPEIPMDRFTTQTLVNGQNLDHMSDESVFSAIANMENEITTLEKIENKPARLTKQIKAIRSDINGIIKYLDAKDSDDDTAADSTS